MDLKSKITLLVNTCDSYCDCGDIFFKLLSKYGVGFNLDIIFNTESKEYSYPGLNIKCIHPEKIETPYGKRLKNAVSHIKTPYVIPILDDFFIRKPVNEQMIENILAYMDKDEMISVFYSAQCGMWPNLLHKTLDNNKYDDYCRIAPGTDYTLTTHAGVGRTKDYYDSGKDNISPLEGEMFTNTITYGRFHKKKYYIIKDNSNLFIDYGGNYGEFSITRGKGAVESVNDFFKKENIIVDYSKRGIYHEEDEAVSLDIKTSNFKDSLDTVIRSMGNYYAILFVCFSFFYFFYKFFKQRLNKPYSNIFAFMSYKKIISRKGYSKLQ